MTGYVSIEIPHLQRLIDGRLYDTIYHEHFSYLSLLTTQRVLAAAGLTVVDVEELPTHGGSLRTWSTPSGGRAGAEHRGGRRACRRSGSRSEYAGGARGLRRRGRRCAQRSRRLPRETFSRRRSGRRLRRPGKGNTLLNHAGVRSDLLAFTVDRNPFKHGKYLPGTHIPIHPVEQLAEERPDYVLILPWNLKAEISAQLAYVREWGGQLVVPLPSLEVF